MLATRAMKAWADSRACVLTADIWRAWRAAASLCALQVDASIPKWRMRLMPVGKMCSMKRRTNSAPSSRTRRLPPWSSARTVNVTALWLTARTRSLPIAVRCV